MAQARSESSRFSEAALWLRSSLKWLYPGMRVKRWLLLVPVGISLVIIGVGLITNLRTFDYLRLLDDLARTVFLRFGVELNLPRVYVPVSLAFMAAGLLLIFVSIKQTIGSITSALVTMDKRRLADVVFQKRYLAQGQRVVTIGGGTGLSTLLRGLKQYTSNIVAIVTVTDDGGSSGALQRQFGMLPPGDIRNCLVALADAETLMTELLQYRFDGRGDHQPEEGRPQSPGTPGSLEGHSFGNLLLAAMTHLTGDFEMAVKETSRVLAIRGRVLPSTVQNVSLMAEMEDGTVVEGETSILKAPGAIRSIYLNPPEVQPLSEALDAIHKAEAIIIGPGSVFTSIIPNLLVRGIPEAISRSKALKVYVCNVMTQPGETDGFGVVDHIRAIERHAPAVRLFDYVLMNDSVPSRELLERYRREGADLVPPDVEGVRQMGYHPVVAPLISETEVVRHDPDKLASAVMRLLFERAPRL